MINIRNNSIVLLIFLLALFGIIHAAMASEITGTLSSDGSTGVQEENTSDGTTIEGSNSTGQTLAQQNNNKLQGRVVHGKDESAALSFIDVSSWTITAWLISLATVILTTLVYFSWRRKADRRGV